MFQCHDHTVRATLKHWESARPIGLMGSAGSGFKTALDRRGYGIEACINDESRTYSSVQLSRKLKEAGLVNLSSDRLRDLIKKTIAGNERAIAIVKSKTRINGRLNEAIAIEAGVENRYLPKGYQVERFIFHSAY